MKKYLKSYLSKSLLIAGLLPLIVLAEPKVGDRCEGDASYKEHGVCKISLIGQQKMYTRYAITFMNVGNKVGYLYSTHNIYSIPVKRFPEYLGAAVAPKGTGTLIADSHYCTPDGQIRPGDLNVAGTDMGWQTDYIQMQITNVTVVKTTPLSSMTCGA